MRVLCVARHEFLSGHLCQYFSECGVEAYPVVGLDDAIVRARGVHPDVVVCDYDLLTGSTLEQWEREPELMHLPILAVSLTRRPDEVFIAVDALVAGFLYLPTLDRSDALRLLAAAARTRGVQAPSSIPWPGARAMQYR